MLSLLLIAGLTVVPVDLGEPVLDVRVVDLDADGVEDIIAVTKTRTLLWRGGEGKPIERPKAQLIVVGKGLVGVVRDGRYRPVADPFGAWEEGDPGPRSLLAALGRNEPRLLDAPGDVTGDGRDDPVIASLQGVHAPAGLLPITPDARLEISRNECFAVEYQLPVPVVGNWSGKPRELVFFHKNAVVSFHGLKETDRLSLPLSLRGKGAEAIRRNHVFLRDIDNDGRLDLVVVVARGKEGLFGEVEATASVWLGGRIYNRERKGFYKRAAVLKVDGALIAPALIDVDGDNDLDLVLSTIRASILSGASGTAPGAYLVFRFDNGSYARKPAWSHKGTVPMSTFTKKPIPPVTFLRDLDGSGRPRAVEFGKDVALLEADGATFKVASRWKLKPLGVPSCGRRIAVVRGETGVLILRGKP